MQADLPLVPSDTLTLSNEVISRIEQKLVSIQPPNPPRQKTKKITANHVSVNTANCAEYLAWGNIESCANRRNHCSPSKQHLRVG